MTVGVLGSICPGRSGYMRKTVACIVFCFISFASLSAQRTVAVFQPQLSDPELVFDTNEIPLAVNFASEANFSPNMLFTPDSSRAFVSFPASDRVGVFNTRTGTLIATVQVRSNPVTLTMTPDGSKIAVPCLFLAENTPRPDNSSGDRVGAISIIDVETLQVSNLDLPETVFSFASNIVFSNDSRTGFVSSTGTDELIRFDVATATEAGARLAFEDGSRPIPITMSQDGSFFGVVLVGSSAIDRLEVPDSIQIIDSATFSISKSLAFPPDEGLLPHDFQASNNVAFSHDGSLAFIGEQSNSATASAVGFPPQLIADQALLIDLESEELIGTFSLGTGLTGGVAGGAYTTPDGRFFVILTASDIGVVNIESQVILNVTPIRGQFQPSSRPAFTSDGKMFIAAPLTDFLMTFDPSTGDVMRGVSIGGIVQRPIQETSIFVPSGPMQVAVSPDESLIAAVHFNANSVELLQPAFSLTSPQFISQNLAIPDPDSLETVPLGERFFTGIAVSNYGEKDADIIATAFDALGFPIGNLFAPNSPIGRLLIIADPNPIQICDGGLGQTTISWDTTAVTEEIEIRIGSVDGELLATGEATGSVETGQWVTDGMTFVLIDQTTGEIIDFVTAFLTDLGCPDSLIVALPNPIQVCDEGFGQTNIRWDATEISEEVQIEVRIGSAEGDILASAGAVGNRTTGNWVSDGLMFFLLDQANGDVLGTVTVNLTEEGCVNPATLELKPGEQISFTVNSFLTPDTLLNEESDPTKRDIDGWMDLDSDQSTLAGMFLSFDGELNRMDGGTLVREATPFAVFPEVRINEGFSTQLEIANPNLSSIFLFLDLFNSDGSFVGSAQAQVPARSRRVFPILGDPNDPDDFGLFDGLQRIAASPNPIQSCDGGLAQTTISWNATGLAEEVEVRVDSADGNLLGAGGVTGTVETGEWVREGMTFFLVDTATLTVLDTVIIAFTELGCDPPLITVDPNPIQVCDGGLGQARITWSASGTSEEVEIRSGSVDGPVLASGGTAGVLNTGREIPDGQTFLMLDLQNESAVIDSITVSFSQAGCDDPLIPAFEEGYIRAAGMSFVAFEAFSDNNRLAVLAGQPLGSESTHFTIPHFIAFGGADTVLQLIHPSNLPLGGFIPEEDDEEAEEGEGEEEEEVEPIAVSLTLRADDGSTISGPVSVDLPNGVSRRVSIIDLFGLVDGGSIQTGWIEVKADRAGLVGSAVLLAFDSQAMSAVPLQPVRSSMFVFPHVAHGLGFGTGLSVVNPSDQPAQVTIELRRPNAELAATEGPFILGPGNRLLGTMGELFPEAGQIIGGSLRIISDIPLTSMELFFTDNSTLLSVIPPQEIGPDGQ